MTLALPREHLEQAMDRGRLREPLLRDASDLDRRGI